jgi:hypothetical protein
LLVPVAPILGAVGVATESPDVAVVVFAAAGVVELVGAGAVPNNPPGFTLKRPPGAVEVWAVGGAPNNPGVGVPGLAPKRPPVVLAEAMEGAPNKLPVAAGLSEGAAAVVVASAGLGGAPQENPEVPPVLLAGVAAEKRGSMRLIVHKVKKFPETHHLVPQIELLKGFQP